MIAFVDDTPLDQIERVLKREQALAVSEQRMDSRVAAVTELSLALHAAETMYQTGREILGMCEKIWGPKNAAAMFKQLAGKNNAAAVQLMLERPWQAAPLHSDNWALRVASNIIRSVGGYDRVPDLAKDIHGQQIDTIPDLKDVVRKLNGDIEAFQSAMQGEHVRERIKPDDKSSYLILQSRLAGEVNNAWHQMIRLHPDRSSWQVPENPTPAVIRQTIRQIKQDREKRSTEHQQELNRLVTELPKQDASLVSTTDYRRIVHSAGIRGFNDVVDKLRSWAKDGKVGTKSNEQPAHHRRKSDSHRILRTPTLTGPEKGR